MQDNKIVSWIINMIYEKKSNIRISEIENELGIDRYKLYRFFKTNMGISIKDYISKVRIEFIDAYIEKGLTIEEICKEIDISKWCLNKFLKANTGLNFKDYYEMKKNGKKKAKETKRIEQSAKR